MRKVYRKSQEMTIKESGNSQKIGRNKLGIRQEKVRKRVRKELGKGQERVRKV